MKDLPYLAEAFRLAIGDTPEIVTAIRVGSTALGTDDEFSDLDYFLYADEPNWSHGRVHSWLLANDLQPLAHHWTGVEKHYLLFVHGRVDISIRSIGQRAELLTWPMLFFNSTSGIVKDEDLELSRLIAEHRRQAPPPATNDLDGAILSLMSTGVQLLRGEELSARSRASNAVEALTRVIERPPFGEPAWREPTRRLSSSTPGGPQGAIVRRLAFAATVEELREAVVDSLAFLSGEVLMHEREELESEIRDLVTALMAKRRGRT